MITDMDFPQYPYDLEELKHIDALLNKIPKYREKIVKLREDIEELSRNAQNAGSFSSITEIDDLICKAFYLDLENRPFNTEDSPTIGRLKAEVKWHGTIKNRNIPCEICCENRAIDKCHIIPAKFGGLKQDDNLLYLCPTHHRLFDRFMLSKKEWSYIDWERKSKPSQKYAYSVTLESHKKFWEKIISQENEKLPLYDINEKPFIEYVANEIGNLFIAGKMIKRDTIYKMMNENLRDISKKVLAELIKHKLIIQVKKDKSNMLLLASSKFTISPEIVLKIWQNVD